MKMIKYVDYMIIALIIMGASNTYARCTISTTPLALRFGNYDALSGNSTNSNATLIIQCTRSEPGTIGISAGSSGNVSQRNMVSGTTTDKLIYNLYKDAANTQVWGNSGTQLVSFPSAPTTTVTIYGNIPKSQNIAIGNYNDNNLVMTVTY